MRSGYVSGVLTVALCFLKVLTAMSPPLLAQALEELDGIDLQHPVLQGERATTAHVAWVDLNVRRTRILVPGSYQDRDDNEPSGPIEDGWVSQKAKNITGMPIEGYLRESRSQLVLSGGFMSSFYPPIPLGYVQVGKRAINRMQRDRLLNGMFCTARGRAAITLLPANFDPLLWDDCLQAGPLLIANGKNVLDPVGLPDGFVPKPHHRAFIGVDDSGHVALGIVEGIRLDELAELLAEGRLGPLTDVLNLAGAGSAGMTWRSQDGAIRLAGNGREFLANAIAAQ